MAKTVVKKAASADVAAAAQEAVAQAKTEKTKRTPPAPTGYTTAGQGDKRVPWTEEELKAELSGNPDGVYILEKEWRGKPHYSIVVCRNGAPAATKGGCFELERAVGFTATHARKEELQMQHQPGGDLQDPPAITRSKPAENAEESAEESAPKTAKKVVKKQA